MHPVSQIIERNIPRVDCNGKGLWINPEKDACWQTASGACNTLSLFCHDHGAFRYHQSSGVDASFGAFPDRADGKYAWVILNLPRQKALLDMMLDCVTTLLADDGILWLAGENRAGIKSAFKRLKQRFSRVRKLDSARHCNLFEASGPLARAVFDPRAYRDEWRLETGHGNITVASYPGVFAHGRLDAGTALLLDVVQGLPVEGEVLDFACGAGVIGACIARQNTNTHVTLLDVNALALRACEETLAANRVEGAVIASDGLSELIDTFDLVVSNPPIHAGVRTDTGLGMRLMGSAHDHVRPGGRLIMVANIHLPYEKWLQQNFRRSRLLATNEQFKVIGAEK